MNFASTLPLPTYLPEDRSLGTEAKELRESCREAVARKSANSASKTLSRLLEALNHANERDGTIVSLGVFYKTQQFMISLPAELPVPIVVVESEEEIGLDWDEAADRILSLTIDSSDRIGYSALIGREPIYGRVDYIHGLPETLQYILARLYPSTRLQ